ncbi:MAG TPA: DUF4783 domain-containing protein [Bacteroidota bacterium]|nr:DUF4783 domain-containing protein [Bacteroidota bacterium]
MIFTFLFLTILFDLSLSQEQPQRRNSFLNTRPDRSVQTNPEIQRMLTSIERGVAAGTPEVFFGSLSDQVWMSIVGGERGVYSNNQALAILQSFFANRRPISFQFSRIDEVASTPYATGRFVYINRGKQESSQIYVSLEERGSQWVVTQFNIY